MPLTLTSLVSGDVHVAAATSTARTGPGLGGSLFGRIALAMSRSGLVYGLGRWLGLPVGILLRVIAYGARDEWSVYGWRGG